MILEPMADFFAARVNGYDEHMLNNVEGCRGGYIKMAQTVQKFSEQYTRPLRILDLGCGTGLELDEIFKLLPQVSVTGIDITSEMLQKLREKHSDKDLTLICGNYFDIDLGESAFDCAVSFQSLHHFDAQKKTELYRRINRALTSCGIYIECDYMAGTQAEEDFYFNENARLRREMNAPENKLYHYDTPMTIENQKHILHKAGFSKVDTVFRQGNTAMLAAEKNNAP